MLCTFALQQVKAFVVRLECTFPLWPDGLAHQTQRIAYIILRCTTLNLYSENKQSHQVYVVQTEYISETQRIFCQLGLILIVSYN